MMCLHTPSLSRRLRRTRLRDAVFALVSATTELAVSPKLQRNMCEVYHLRNSNEAGSCVKSMTQPEDIPESLTDSGFKDTQEESCREQSREVVRGGRRCNHGAP